MCLPLNAFPHARILLLPPVRPAAVNMREMFLRLLCSSSGSCPLKDSTLTTVGFAFISVPVLIQIRSSAPLASDTASAFTVTLCCPASRIAESTIGIAQLRCTEKSAIRTDSVFVTFLVSTYVSAVPASVYEPDGLPGAPFLLSSLISAFPIPRSFLRSSQNGLRRLSF